MKKQQEPKNAIITWKSSDDNETKAIAFHNLYSSLAKTQQPFKTFASNIYRDAYDGVTSIRDEFSRDDYELYRPGESLPSSSKGKIKAADKAYWNHGIIRNIFDLMGDFAAQGIDLCHPVQAHQDFYKAWFKYVDGPGRTERFANLLCRMANVIPKRITAKLKPKEVEQYRQLIAAADKDYLPTTIETEPRELPIQYVFINPLTLEIVGEELSAFIDPSKTIFKLNIPTNLSSKIKYPSNDSEKALVKMLPDDILKAIKKGNNFVILDSNKVSVYHYKKDDWQSWATPMVCSVLKDLNMLDKMKLADLSALDGVISQIRVWKLGNIAERIIPTEEAINKLAEILINSVPGGILDLIWGPDLEFKEVTSNLHNFLGDTKYTPVLNAIYAGLGIPPLFTGSDKQGSFTNNFIAIKTLIERLNYVRGILRKFWETEIKIVQKAMGFDKPAYVVFDRMTLNDEASILQLLLHLVDRNYLSIETVQEMVGAVPEIESIRIKRETKQIEKGKRPKKASPFHNPQIEEEYKKQFIQQGTLTPSELGIELEQKKRGEKTPVEMKAENTKVKEMPSDLNGRPNGSKDKIKRKQKQVKIRTSASYNDYIQVLAWAENGQSTISDILTPIYLKSINKENLRQLTTEEFQGFEKLKFGILYNTKPFSEITEDIVVNKIKENSVNIDSFANKLLMTSLAKYKNKTNKELTANKIRYFQSAVYAAVNCTDKDNETNNINYDLPTLS